MNRTIWFTGSACFLAAGALALYAADLTGGMLWAVIGGYALALCSVAFNCGLRNYGSRKRDPLRRPAQVSWEPRLADMPLCMSLICIERGISDPHYHLDVPLGKS